MTLTSSHARVSCLLVEVGQDCLVTPESNDK